jgi:hypothetical protein
VQLVMTCTLYFCRQLLNFRYCSIKIGPYAPIKYIIGYLRWNLVIYVGPVKFQGYHSADKP